MKAFIIAGGVLGASVLPAYAQQATGSWAGMFLPSENYAISMNSQTWPAPVTVRATDGPIVAIVLPEVISEDRLMRASSLVLHEEGGESIVSMLRLADLGLALEFASPKLAMPVAESAKLGPMPGSRPSR